eukprot:2309415-Rhodomonas_salina.1
MQEPKVAREVVFLRSHLAVTLAALLRVLLHRALSALLIHFGLECSLCGGCAVADRVARPPRDSDVVQLSHEAARAAPDGTALERDGRCATCNILRTKNVDANRGAVTHSYVLEDEVRGLIHFHAYLALGDFAFLNGDTLVGHGIGGKASLSAVHDAKL